MVIPLRNSRTSGRKGESSRARWTAVSALICRVNGVAWVMSSAHGATSLRPSCFSLPHTSRCNTEQPYYCGVEAPDTSAGGGQSRSSKYLKFGYSMTETFSCDLRSLFGEEIFLYDPYIVDEVCDYHDHGGQCFRRREKPHSRCRALGCYVFLVGAIFAA